MGVKWDLMRSRAQEYRHRGIEARQRAAQADPRGLHQPRRPLWSWSEVLRSGEIRRLWRPDIEGMTVVHENEPAFLRSEIGQVSLHEIIRLHQRGRRRLYG